MEVVAHNGITVDADGEDAAQLLDARLDRRLAMLVVLQRIRINPTQPRAAHTAVGAVVQAMLACEDDAGTCLSHAAIVATAESGVCQGSTRLLVRNF